MTAICKTANYRCICHSITRYSSEAFISCLENTWFLASVRDSALKIRQMYVQWERVQAQAAAAELQDQLLATQCSSDSSIQGAPLLIKTHSFHHKSPCMPKKTRAFHQDGLGEPADCPLNCRLQPWDSDVMAFQDVSTPSGKDGAQRILHAHGAQGSPRARTAPPSPVPLKQPTASAHGAQDSPSRSLAGPVSVGVPPQQSTSTGSTGSSTRSDMFHTPLGQRSVGLPPRPPGPLASVEQLLATEARFFTPALAVSTAVGMGEGLSALRMGALAMEHEVRSMMRFNQELAGAASPSQHSPGSDIHLAHPLTDEGSWSSGSPVGSRSSTRCFDSEGASTGEELTCVHLTIPQYPLGPARVCCTGDEQQQPACDGAEFKQQGSEGASSGDAAAGAPGAGSAGGERPAGQSGAAGGGGGDPQDDPQDDPWAPVPQPPYGSQCLVWVQDLEALARRPLPQQLSWLRHASDPAIRLVLRSRYALPRLLEEAGALVQQLAAAHNEECDAEAPVGEGRALRPQLLVSCGGTKVYMPEPKSGAGPSDWTRPAHWRDCSEWENHFTKGVCVSSALRGPEFNDQVQGALAAAHMTLPPDLQAGCPDAKALIKSGAATGSAFLVRARVPCDVGTSTCADYLSSLKLRLEEGGSQLGVHITEHPEAPRREGASEEGPWCSVDCVPATTTRALTWACKTILGVDVADVFQPGST